jgi:hypothetical protein
MHFWGVKANTVWQWRKALGVPQYNPGTTALKVELSPPSSLKVELMTPILDEARKKARPTWSSAERRAKIVPHTSSIICRRSERGYGRPACSRGLFGGLIFQFHHSGRV